VIEQSLDLARELALITKNQECRIILPVHLKKELDANQ